MTDLAAPTEVFARGDTDAAIVVGLLTARPGAGTAAGVADRPAERVADRAADRVVDCLADLAAEGWALSVGAMYGDTGSAPAAYLTGFAHDRDAMVVFEAPSLADALTGTVRLERAGWARRWRSEWLLGPREFATVRSPSPRRRPGDWGFVALWEWNDAWQAATPAQRETYDAECDEAFAADLRLGADIAGRHRLDWASTWHHVGVWDCPSPQGLDEAMREHERVADFKYTTSRHYLGRRVPLAALLEGTTHA